MSDPAPQTFLVFGDLHGRILPAFRFASYWARLAQRAPVALLQVGDLGYFPDISRIDKATLRHAKDDPLELGTLDVVERTELADRTFDDDPHSTFDLWFTAGNHEDFDELERLARASGNQPDFVADAYCRVRGIKDGAVRDFPIHSGDCLAGSACQTEEQMGLKAGAIWGVDGHGANGRKNLPPRGYIAEKAVDRLSLEAFDVLLSHDAPKDAKRVGYGSELLAALIESAQPRFAFFGRAPL
jgi:hypothetical protein